MNWPKRFNIFQFSEQGRHYIFAAASLYLFETDQITADILRKAETSTRNQILSIFSQSYPKQEIEGVFGEVDRLVEAKILSPCGGPSDARSPDPNLRQLSEKPTFSDLWLILTHDCNLSCGYCFSTAEYMQSGCEMTRRIALKSVDYLISHCAGQQRLRIIFFGGEPLMKYDLIKDTVSYARRQATAAEKKISFAITTNGTLLDHNVRQFLIENDFSIMVSIDGPQALHDTARRFRDGSGSFKRIAPRLKALTLEAAAAGIGIQGRTTLNRHHLGHIEGLYEFMDQEMGFASISTPIVHRPAPAQFTYIEEDLPQLEEDLCRLGDYVVDRASHEGKTPAFGLFSFLDVLHDRARPMRGCAAGRLAVTVDHDGSLYPCERFVGMQDFCLGSAFGKQFRGERVRSLSEQDRICAYKKCLSCYAVLYCKSTCVAERLRYLGEAGPSEVDCEIYRMILRQILRVYVRLYDRPVKDFPESMQSPFKECT